MVAARPAADSPLFFNLESKKNRIVLYTGVRYTWKNTVVSCTAEKGVTNMNGCNFPPGNCVNHLLD